MDDISGPEIKKVFGEGFRNKLLSQPEKEKSLTFCDQVGRYPKFTFTNLYFIVVYLPYNFLVGWSGRGRHQNNEEICHDRETCDATGIPV